MTTLKSTRHLFATLFIVYLLASCQKEVTGNIDTSTQTTTTSGNVAKVKTYTEDVTLASGSHYKETFNLTYDNNDRLLSLISTSTPGNKSIYKYNTDNTFTMDIYIANVLSIHELFFLNNLPYVDSTVQYDAASNDTTTEKYIYNSNKQLLTLRQYHYSKATGSTLLSTTDYSYDNVGNVIKEVASSGITAYEYYPDWINNLSTGLIYFQQNKNLEKTTTTTLGSNGSQVIQHTYTFDNEKRITSEKNASSNGDVSILSFTY